MDSQCPTWCAILTGMNGTKEYMGEILRQLFKPLKQEYLLTLSNMSPLIVLATFGFSEWGNRNLPHFLEAPILRNAPGWVRSGVCFQGRGSPRLATLGRAFCFGEGDLDSEL